MKTTNRLTLLTLVLASILFASSSAQAAYDIFMQVTGVTGESTSATHPQWIEIYSISQSVLNPPNSASGKPQFSDISLTKIVDKSSPSLIQSCNLGTPITTVTIDFEKSGTTPAVFYKLTLENVVVTGVQQSGSAGGDSVMETVTMNFSKIRWTYTPIDPKTGKPGTKVETGWDVPGNKKY